MATGMESMFGNDSRVKMLARQNAQSPVQPVKQIGSDPNKQYALGSQPGAQPQPGFQPPTAMPHTMAPAPGQPAPVNPTQTNYGLTPEEMEQAKKYGYTPTSYNALTGANRPAWDLPQGYDQQAYANAETNYNRQKLQEAISNYNSPKGAQERFATEFRSGLPQMQQQMGDQLTKQSGMQMQQNLRGLNEDDSSRGLLYGGLHQGKEARVRGGAQANLAGAMTHMNSGLQNSANSIDQQAIQTGLGVQQFQQQQQNQIYSRALAEMSASNAFTGNIIGTGIATGLLMA